VEADTRADRLIVNGALLVDVTRLRRRESLTLVMKDSPAYAGPLKSAHRDGS
jgi:hypothetical protein